jgi:hypothetical protein
VSALSSVQAHIPMDRQAQLVPVILLVGEVWITAGNG